MNAPVVLGLLVNLKTRGVSNFYIHVENVQDDDTIIVKRSDNGAGYWEGTVKVKGNNRKGAKATVRYNIGIPPLTTTKKKKVYGPGDIIEVTITVTNPVTGPGSITIPGGVIIDDGP